MHLQSYANRYQIKESLIELTYMVKQKLNKMKKQERILLFILGLVGTRLFITCIVGVLIFRGCIEPMYEGLVGYPHENLGAGYEYIYDDRDIVGMHNDGEDIPQVIEEYKFDERFIVARQVIDGDPVYGYDDTIDYYLGYDSTYYWIIDKNDTTRYGPMDYGRFHNLCDSLNVGLSL